mmetsp:Transcript_32697/g.62794  ORF Transcript_32697/g.62794 Transcript_32697/m.62794 type:complete len:343 (-) Transcript_32697:306-1334(-)
MEDAAPHVHRANSHRHLGPPREALHLLVVRKNLVDGGHCAGDVARAGAARGLEHLARSLRHLLHALAAHHLENLRRGFVLQVDAQLVVARLLEHGLVGRDGVLEAEQELFVHHRAVLLDGERHLRVRHLEPALPGQQEARLGFTKHQVGQKHQLLECLLLQRLLASLAHLGAHAEDAVAHLLVHLGRVRVLQPQRRLELDQSVRLPPAKRNVSGGEEAVKVVVVHSLQLLHVLTAHVHTVLLIDCRHLRALKRAWFAAHEGVGEFLGSVILALLVHGHGSRPRSRTQSHSPYHLASRRWRARRKLGTRCKSGGGSTRYQHQPTCHAPNRRNPLEERRHGTGL